MSSDWRFPVWLHVTYSSLCCFWLWTLAHWSSSSCSFLATCRSFCTSLLLLTLWAKWLSTVDTNTKIHILKTVSTNQSGSAGWDHCSSGEESDEWSAAERWLVYLQINSSSVFSSLRSSAIVRTACREQD